MKQSKQNSQLFLILLGVWGIVDLLCAMFCEIHADEAYYRLFGQYLDWGYYDQPPMVALMAYVSDILVGGTSLVAKNLSVRLMTVLLHMGTVGVVWKTLAMAPTKKNVIGFFVIAGSLVMFNAYGFITAPDAPLLFFAALFFYGYKQYLQQPSWGTALLLGVSIAGMVYSKYMAVLVVLLVVLSNWRLVKDVRLWVAIGVACCLLLPHLWWQYMHHFSSLTCQWMDRVTSWKSVYSLEYIPNQLLVFNPIVFVWVWMIAFRSFFHKDAFTRSLIWQFVGFELFFACMTLREHVEPHWTMVASIPVILLLMPEWEKASKWLRYGTGVCLILVCLTRVVLMANVLPERTGLANKRPYYEAMLEVSEGLPIVLDGSFQRPSLYMFYYPDEQAVLVRQPWDPYNQFYVWNFASDLVGQPVCVLRQDSSATQVACRGYVFPKKTVSSFSMDEQQ